MRSKFPLLAFWLAACASSSAPDGGMDAGRDAGVDAGRDGGFDASLDARRDASRDGGEDLGFSSLPGLPTRCTSFQVARGGSERVSWQPCFDGRAECNELDVAWGNWEVRGTFQVGHRMYPMRGAPRVVFVRELDVSRELVVSRDDGSIEHRVRWPIDAGRRCSLGAFGAASFEDERSVIGVSIWGDDAMVFAAYDLADTRAPLITMSADEVGDADRIASLSVESGVLAFGTSPSARVASLRGDFGWLPLEERSPDPVVSRGRVLVRQAGSGRLLAELPDRTLATLVEAPDAYVGATRANEDTLVWVEARDSVDGRRYWTDRRLMTATWDESGEVGTPMQLAQLGEGPMIEHVIVDGGWVVWSDLVGGVPRTRAHHLREGAIVDLQAPEGYAFAPLIAVHDDELIAGVWSISRAIERTVWRMKLR